MQSQEKKKSKKDWSIFITSIFFVLGFSVVFSLVGVLLQTTLTHVSYSVQTWLGRFGGIIIILFGLFLLKLITPTFLLREYKFEVKKKFKSHYLTSFLFGAAFAVGWTPCVGAVLGGILTLAATQPTSAFILLFSYTLGLGIPFLLVGLFTNQARTLIKKSGKFTYYLQYVFGVVLILIGILVFTGQLSRVANNEALATLFGKLSFGVGVGSGVSGASILTLGLAFIAGFASFLSPCVLPLIPGFLSYLASLSVSGKNEVENEK